MHYIRGDFTPVTKVCTIVILVPTEQGSKGIKLRHLNFDPDPCHTRTGPCVTLGSYTRNNSHVLSLRLENKSLFGGVNAF